MKASVASCGASVASSCGRRAWTPVTSVDHDAGGLDDGVSDFGKPELGDGLVGDRRGDLRTVAVEVDDQGGGHFAIRVTLPAMMLRVLRFIQSLLFGSCP